MYFAVGTQNVGHSIANQFCCLILCKKKHHAKIFGCRAESSWSHIKVDTCTIHFSTCFAFQFEFQFILLFIFESIHTARMLGH